MLAIYPASPAERFTRSCQPVPARCGSIQDPRMAATRAVANEDDPAPAPKEGEDVELLAGLGCRAPSAPGKEQRSCRPCAPFSSPLPSFRFEGIELHSTIF